MDKSIYEEWVFINALNEAGLLDDFHTKEALASASYSFESMPLPDVIIWLDAKPRICLERIKTRGRPMEKDITLMYLQLQRKWYRLLMAEVAKVVTVIRIPWNEFRPVGEAIFQIKRILDGRQCIQTLSFVDVSLQTTIPKHMDYRDNTILNHIAKKRSFPTTKGSPIYFVPEEEENRSCSFLLRPTGTQPDAGCYESVQEQESSIPLPYDSSKGLENVFVCWDCCKARGLIPMHIRCCFYCANNVNCFTCPNLNHGPRHALVEPATCSDCDELLVRTSPCSHINRSGCPEHPLNCAGCPEHPRHRPPNPDIEKELNNIFAEDELILLEYAKKNPTAERISDDVMDPNCLPHPTPTAEEEEELYKYADDDWGAKSNNSHGDSDRSNCGRPIITTIDESKVCSNCLKLCLKEQFRCHRYLKYIEDVKRRDWMLRCERENRNSQAFSDCVVNWNANKVADDAPDRTRIVWVKDASELWFFISNNWSSISKRLSYEPTPLPVECFTLPGHVVLEEVGCPVGISKAHEEPVRVRPILYNTVKIALSLKNAEDEEVEENKK